MSALIKSRIVTTRSRSPKSRILLRSPVPSDSYSLLVRGRDPECTTYLPHLRNPKVPITLASCEKQIKAWRVDSGIKLLFLVVVLLSKEGGAQDNEANTDGATASESRPTGLDPLATIGEGGFWPIDIAFKTGEIGIMLNSSPSMRGKGLAMEALDMKFAYGFDYLQLDTITLGTHKDNVPMRNLLEKKFGLMAQWREEDNDWGFHCDKSSW